jgi:thermostable 8-oxoguanine DNA glycosylase
MTLSREVIIEKAQEYQETVSDDFYREEENHLERLPTVFENGTWEWEDLEWIVCWKTHRSIGYFNRNDRDRVDEVIAKVVESSSTQRKANLLRRLDGIQVKMASAFLLFMDPDKYTVIDWRAANALTKEGHLYSMISEAPSVEEYINYLDICRTLYDEFNVELRTLDRALWVLGEGD